MDQPSATYYDYRHDDDPFEAYIAFPPDPGSVRPGVLLAHDWSGLNQGIRRIAERIAAQGYVCFALDVYGKGVRGDELGDNTHLMAPLMADRACLRGRLLAGLAAAVEHPAIDGERVAVVGYCFGGLCALDLARADPPGLRAAISVHGGLTPPGLGAQRSIRASVLLLHGWEDPVAPTADVLAVARELTDAGADWQLHAYGHAMHAFTFAGVDLPERGLRYDPVADRRAWAALTGLLEQTLADGG
ncbi:MAG: dienelactone hydrolase family protein [Myxococcota bacterium]